MRKTDLKSRRTNLSTGAIINKGGNFDYEFDV